PRRRWLAARPHRPGGDLHRRTTGSTPPSGAVGGHGEARPGPGLLPAEPGRGRRERTAAVAVGVPAAAPRGPEGAGAGRARVGRGRRPADPLGRRPAGGPARRPGHGRAAEPGPRRRAAPTATVRAAVEHGRRVPVPAAGPAADRGRLRRAGTATM